MKDKFMLIVT